mmetsp:Transcript_26986/g.56250  ORF Transcript_26986/g.56250 Transcript_26986/m.56250 type:complete len:384 (-) Transcript_26986:123-1274(-)
MGIKNLLLWRIIPGIALALATAIGWFASHEVPMGRFFATIVPLMKGVLPPTIVGHGRMSGTPPVPDDLMPKPRPKNEMFLTLPAGTGKNKKKAKFPQNGLGMCCRATAYDDVLVYRTVLWYLLLGGRHIDGAHLYLNHNAIGNAIKEAIRRGIDRSEIFVTTKIAPSHYGYEKTMATVQNFLSEDELGLDYIDLVLMHAPSFPLSTACGREGKDAATCRKETWLALSALREEGVIRNAGVSNFGVNHLREFENVGAPIANNQIEYNPFVPEYITETFEYCDKHNIAITAYFPLGGDIANKDKAMRNEILGQLSEKYDKSVSQIMLRWAIQKGCAVIPGTGNPKHMQENLDVYGFKLKDEDMQTISELKHGVSGFTHMDYRSAA